MRSNALVVDGTTSTAIIGVDDLDAGDAEDENEDDAGSAGTCNSSGVGHIANAGGFAAQLRLVRQNRARTAAAIAAAASTSSGAVNLTNSSSTATTVGLGMMNGAGGPDIMSDLQRVLAARRARETEETAENGASGDITPISTMDGGVAPISSSGQTSGLRGACITGRRASTATNLNNANQSLVGPPGVFSTLI
ncbi:unnamed protein product [Protopolystoma xenopodis]|uniref:Uncharacterized protein n=1 Tax=Protopolystoma xenopodis TaxID=117903 RepID=A0A3S5CNA3_9PLAT|nr:unnamed protein product [Protopolystoma xenopodis]